MTFFTLAAFMLAGVAAQPPQAHAQAQASTAALPSFDFTRSEVVAGWGMPHDIARIEPTKEGMAIHISGPDPYCYGPERAYPTDLPLSLKIRLKPSSGGQLQVFYTTAAGATDEEHSAHAAVKSGVWQDVSVALPPIGPRARLRIDPPGRRGVCLVASIKFEPRLVIAAPNWPKPTVPKRRDDGQGWTLSSEKNPELALWQDKDELGGFVVLVSGEPFATGHNRPMIGYNAPDGRAVRWIDVAKTARVESSLSADKRVISVKASFPDPDGGRWTLSQTFRNDGRAAIGVSAECSVDAPRDVVFLPLLLVLPGHGSFGGIKGQGLFAGVEYLENEPSSSTADLNEKAGANRLVPESRRITFPLMAIQTHGKYLGLIWDRAPEICALFDSPDRTLGSGAHALGILAPGAEGANRANGELFPSQPMRLEPGKTVRANAMLIGGKGASVVPAIEQYLALRGLPELPTTPDLEGYVHLTASGWLDTPIRVGHHFRHAVGGSFGAHPAADAAYMMEQLAALTTDATLAQRLKTEARQTAAAVPPSAWLHAAVGHVRYPVAPLVLESEGKTRETGGATSASPADPVVLGLDQARRLCQTLMRRFEPDGSVRYRTPSTGIDYGRTHFCDEADGLTAGPVHQLLEAAVFAGDRDAANEGLRLLRIMEKRFAYGVPRGAQTWEIPLHTPDILASAYLVKAFALGYELTGDPELLQAAKYWAWSGVPFVFLVNPTEAKGPGSVGPFATTPVLGATNWVAPNWIGLPVQWCGLVYADGLNHLARFDGSGPWRKLAEGIAASGILQSYPPDHPHRGLLPDSFNLDAQSRNPADINPGTLQPLAISLLGGDRPAATPYQFRALRQSGFWIHAPGALEVIEDHSQPRSSARFKVRAWSPRPSFVVVHGLGEQPPEVKINGQPATITNPPHQFLADRGTLILQISGGDSSLVIGH